MRSVSSAVEVRPTQCTLPSRPTRNLEKFHLMGSVWPEDNLRNRQTSWAFGPLTLTFSSISMPVMSPWNLAQMNSATSSAEPLSWLLKMKNRRRRRRKSIDEKKKERRKKMLLHTREIDYKGKRA